MGRKPSGSEALAAIQVVTVAEVAAALRLARMTIYRMVDDGELEAIRVRGSIRIPLASVTAYLAEHRNGQAGDAA